MHDKPQLPNGELQQVRPEIMVEPVETAAGAEVPMVEPVDTAAGAEVQMEALVEMEEPDGAEMEALVEMEALAEMLPGEQMAVQEATEAGEQAVEQV